MSYEQSDELQERIYRLIEGVILKEDKDWKSRA